MIHQLNITVKWKYCDPDGHLEGDGAFEFNEHFVGSERQLKTYLKKYNGIDIVRCIAEANHDPYFTVIHEIKAK